MMQRAKFLHLLVYVCLIMNMSVLGACSPNSATTESTPTPTPPFVMPQLLPGWLDCKAVLPIDGWERGPSWNGLTIGVSTRSDVDAVLSPSKVRESTWGGYIEYLQPIGEEKIGYGEWTIVYACFDGDTLSMLNFSPGVDSAYFRSLDEWIAEKGKPDRVTWGSSAYSRSLIWPEDGLLVVLLLVSRELGIQTSQIILFPPIAQDEAENSWLLEALPDEQWDSGDHLISDNYKNLEDPWGVEK